MSDKLTSKIELAPQDYDVVPPTKAFSGFRWTYYTSLRDGPLRSRACTFLDTVDWQRLLRYAAESRDNTKCALLPDIGLGYNHMVRIIQFEDGPRWVARLRMPRLEGELYPATVPAAMQSEFCAVRLAQQQSGIPVPAIHMIETSNECGVKAPFMLMDCLEGNVGMDLSMKIPNEHKRSFFTEMAHIQIAISTIRLPKIGTILSLNEDGTYEQGPIPGLGGPFDTATAYFRAWAARAKFGASLERLRAASGQYADEIVSSVASFPQSIDDLADRLSVHDSGPFPLCHGDFGHNNIVVDDDYRVLGVIDWESACAVPWEVAGSLPLVLSAIPPAMDAPWNYDENGNPTNPELAQKLADQNEYIAAVKEEENRLGITRDSTVSAVLEDSSRQSIINAMRLYNGGKGGLYSKLVESLSL